MSVLKNTTPNDVAMRRAIKTLPEDIYIIDIKPSKPRKVSDYRKQFNYQWRNRNEVKD